MISNADTLGCIKVDSLEFYKNIFNKMTHAFVIVEIIFDEKNNPINWKFLYVNPAFEKQTGLNGDLVLDKPITEVLPNVERVWIDEHIPLILKLKHYQFMEYNSNTKRHYKVSAYTISKNQYVGIFEDVTNSIQAEKEFKEKENILENVLNPMREMHVILELVHDENDNIIDYKLLKVNPAFEKLTNLNRTLLEGKNAKDVFGDLFEYWIDQFEKVNKDGQPVVQEQYMGELKKYYRNSAWKVGENLIACIASDITERKIKEYELIKLKEEAKKNDRLKSAFLANMSHEIRTPMNGILGFTSLLQDPAISGEEIKQYTEIIEKSGKRMLSIIKDIVDISKIESGLTELYITESNLNNQIEYLYTFFKPEVEAKGVQLSYSCALSNKNSELFTDREKLYAILTNLIKNAIKNTDQGSIVFGYEIHSGQLEFYVKDTGIGIPKSEQAIIFDRFRQVKNPSKKVVEGTGLGLSISKAYIEMLGGEIWVESKPMHGTIFKFTLPRRKDGTNKTDPSDEKSKIQDVEPNKLKIVIADDDPISNELLKIFLAQKQHQVIQVSNGQQAVDAMRAHDDIDLVLMDIRMPLLNGYQATAQIRTFDKKSIIIAQTAFGLKGDHEKALKAGCNDYLTKPIEQDQLFELIEKYFKKGN